MVYCHVDPRAGKPLMLKILLGQSMKLGVQLLDMLFVMLCNGTGPGYEDGCAAAGHVVFNVC